MGLIDQTILSQQSYLNPLLKVSGTAAVITMIAALTLALLHATPQAAFGTFGASCVLGTATMVMLFRHAHNQETLGQYNFRNESTHILHQPDQIYRDLLDLNAEIIPFYYANLSVSEIKGFILHVNQCFKNGITAELRKVLQHLSLFPNLEEKHLALCSNELKIVLEMLILNNRNPATIERVADEKLEQILKHPAFLHCDKLIYLLTQNPSIVESKLHLMPKELISNLVKKMDPQGIQNNEKIIDLLILVTERIKGDCLQTYKDNAEIILEKIDAVTKIRTWDLDIISVAL